MKSLLVLVCLARVAHAEPDVIATQPLALAARGIAVSYERPLDERFSALAIGAYRDGAGGDYDANTFTVGGELRWWLRSHARMRGPYVAFHASVGHTRVSHDDMGYVGSTTSFTQRFDVGWRWVIKQHVTIAPAVGIAIHEDVSGGMLSPIAHGMIGFGLELGWMR
jgi:hypothetical protein